MSAKSQLRQLPIELLQRGEYQPRHYFSKESLHELAQSIQANGLLQPIIVRPIDSQRFEIIAGERRWRACQLAGLSTVQCLVNDYSDHQAAEAAAAENLNRMDLNPIEEAQAYERLIREFGYRHDEVAAVLGKSRTKITNSLRLLALSQKVQNMIKEGHISEGHGKILVSLPQEIQFQVANQCQHQQWSVRSLEKAVKRLQNNSPKENKLSDPDTLQLEKKLSEHLGSPVKLQHYNGKGLLSIQFYSLDSLDGILDKMQFSLNDDLTD